MTYNVNEMSFTGAKFATYINNKEIYVCLKNISDSIGLFWPAQLRKLKINDIKYTHLELNNDGKSYFFISDSDLSSWFSKIRHSKLKDPIKTKFYLYKQDFIQALHNFWSLNEITSKNLTTNSQIELKNFAQAILEEHIGIKYSDLWCLIHERFDVDRINDLSYEESLQAIEYLKEEKDKKYFRKILQSHSVLTQFNDDELCTLAWLWRASCVMNEAAVEVYPLLKAAEHRLAGTFHSIAHEYPRTINNAKIIIQRETAHIEYHPWNDDNWSRVLGQLRQTKKS